jgi:hypothetical protein
MSMRARSSRGEESRSLHFASDEFSRDDEGFEIGWYPTLRSAQDGAPGLCSAAHEVSRNATS